MKLNCKEVSELLSQSQDRPLEPLERMRLEAHLKLCEGCENFRRQLDFMRRVFRRHPAQVDRDSEAGDPPSGDDA